MKFRLLRRRLTVSSPRIVVRSALPWPLRWMAVALALGFSAALALWAFEVGKSLAGLGGETQKELVALRQEVAQLRAEQDRDVSLNNTSGSRLVLEKAAQEKMASRIRQLESQNQSLRDDLGFFEKLLPASGTNTASIRSLQAEVLTATQLKWQVLVIQPAKNAPEFKGTLEMTIEGTRLGKPWSHTMAAGPQPLVFRQYSRVEGVLQLPLDCQIKTVTAKLTEGGLVRSLQKFTM